MDRHHAAERVTLFRDSAVFLDLRRAARAILDDRDRDLGAPAYRREGVNRSVRNFGNLGPNEVAGDGVVLFVDVLGSREFRDFPVDREGRIVGVRIKRRTNYQA